MVLNCYLKSNLRSENYFVLPPENGRKRQAFRRRRIKSCNCCTNEGFGSQKVYSFTIKCHRNNILSIFGLLQKKRYGVFGVFCYRKYNTLNLYFSSFYRILSWKNSFYQLPISGANYISRISKNGMKTLINELFGLKVATRVSNVASQGL